MRRCRAGTRGARGALSGTGRRGSSPNSAWTMRPWSSKSGCTARTRNARVGTTVSVTLTPAAFEQKPPALNRRLAKSLYPPPVKYGLRNPSGNLTTSASSRAQFSLRPAVPWLAPQPCSNGRTSSAPAPRRLQFLGAADGGRVSVCQGRGAPSPAGPVRRPGQRDLPGTANQSQMVRAGTEAAPLHPWGEAAKGAGSAHGQAQWNQRAKKEDI